MELEWSRERDICNPGGMESVTVLYNKNLLPVNGLYRYSHCHFACKNALSRAVTPRDSSTRFLPVARASSVGAVTHQLEIVRSSTERWSKLAGI